MIMSAFSAVDFSAYATSTDKETWDDGYIVIRTVDDLIGINDDLSANYRLANDIDLSSVDKWVPIGDTIRYLANKVGTGYTDKSVSNYFCGVLDGANHKITNLSINESLNDSEDSTNVYEFGLFANILNATIENLIFENVYIDVDSTNLSTNHSLVGALAGSSENASISNCFVKNSRLNNISGIASGVVGNAFSDANTTFNNVINYSLVSGTVASGIAYGTTRFEYCANLGEITGGTAGGISAGGNTSLYYCYNTGEITGTGYVGGIIGTTEYERNMSNSLQYCNNYGIINYNGSRFCGGIVGDFFIQNMSGIVKNCNNFGKINYTPDNSSNHISGVGGIVGWYNTTSGSDNTLERCSNYGNIIADLTSNEPTSINIGGICGAGTINQLTKLINYGNITSNSSSDISICAGGVCGDVSCYNANNVYNYGDLTFDNVNHTADTSSNNTFLSAGGLSAQGDVSTTYENIGNEGNITVSGNIYRASVGGLFQLLFNNTAITNAYNTGNILVVDNNVSDIDAIRIGGIFACSLNNDSLNISNAYLNGDINFSRGNYTDGKIFVGNIYGENPRGGTIKLNNFYTKSITTYGASDSNIDGKMNIITDFSHQNSFNGFDFSNTWTLQNGKYPTIKLEKNNSGVTFFKIVSNHNLLDKQTIDYEVFSDVEISKYYFGKNSSPSTNDFIEVDDKTNLSFSYEIAEAGYYNLIVVDKNGNSYHDGGNNFYEFDFMSQIGDTNPNKTLVSCYTGANGFAKNYFILPTPDCQKEIFNGWSSESSASSGIFVLTDNYLNNAEYTTTLYATYNLSNCNHSTTYEWVEIEQSCTQDGYTYDRCSICEEIVEQHIFEKTGHSFSSYYEYCLNGCGTKNPNPTLSYISATNSKKYFVGDKIDKSALRVTAYYENGTQRILSEDEYFASIEDTASAGETYIKITYYEDGKTEKTEIDVTVFNPTIYASGNGYDYFNTDYTYLLSSINNTITAVTNPSNVEVNWSCSDSSVLGITKRSSKTANIYVKKPSTNPITITASYTYNGQEYKCSFMGQVFFTVESASISNKKASYVYGDKFSREKIKATIVSGENKETITVNSTESLPSTKKTPGKYKRTVSFYDKTLSYSYIIKCATPKINSVKAASSTSQKISWIKAGGAKGYYVYRATSKKGSYKKIGTTSSTSFTSKKLKANKVYYYKVKAYYSKKSSAYDSAMSAIASGRTKLSTPSSVKATAGKKKITVKWKKVSGAKGYYVYRATSKSGKYKKIATTSKTSYTNKKLKSKKKYYYKVVAYSSTKGCNSAYSKTAGARTK